MFTAFYGLWMSMGEGLIEILGYTEHLVLASGLLIRDITIAHFAEEDPESAWPIDLPLYLADTQFPLPRLSEITGILITVHETILDSQKIPATLVVIDQDPKLIASTSGLGPTPDAVSAVTGEQQEEGSGVPESDPSLTGSVSGGPVVPADTATHAPDAVKPVQNAVPKPRQPARKPRAPLQHPTTTIDPHGPSENMSDGLSRLVTNQPDAGQSTGEDHGRQSKRLQNKPKVHWTMKGIPVIEGTAKVPADNSTGKKGQATKKGKKK